MKKKISSRIINALSLILAIIPFLWFLLGIAEEMIYNTGYILISFFAIIFAIVFILATKFAIEILRDTIKCHLEEWLNT